MNRIRSLRDERKMTQEELAERLGVPLAGRISKYELEMRDIPSDILRKLSEVFDVSIDYILGASDERRRGSSLIRPNLGWDVLPFLNALGNISQEDRDMVLLCLEKPEILWALRLFNGLSARNQRKAVEYMDMLALVEKNKGEGK